MLLSESIRSTGNMGLSEGHQHEVLQNWYGRALELEAERDRLALIAGEGPPEQPPKKKLEVTLEGSLVGFEIQLAKLPAEITHIHVRVS